MSCDTLPTVSKYVEDGTARKAHERGEKKEEAMLPDVRDKCRCLLTIRNRTELNSYKRILNRKKRPQPKFADQSPRLHLEYARLALGPGWMDGGRVKGNLNQPASPIGSPVTLGL